jgi:hypothetical protein
LQATKYGIPVERRQYNWMQIPPPPEEHGAVALLTPKERLERHIVSAGPPLLSPADHLPHLGQAALY